MCRYCWTSLVPRPRTGPGNEATVGCGHSWLCGSQNVVGNEFFSGHLVG